MDNRVTLVCDNKRFDIDPELFLDKDDKRSPSKYITSLLFGGFSEQGKSEIEVLLPCSLWENGWGNAKSLECVLKYCQGDANSVISDLRDNLCALCDVLVTARYLQADEMADEMEALIQNPDVLSVKNESFCDVWQLSLSVSEQVAMFCARAYERWARVYSLERHYAACQPTSMQVVFCLDTTGSMGACLGQMRTRIRDAMTQLHSIAGDNIQFAAMAHGDYCDGVPIRTTQFSPNIEKTATFVSHLSPAGGGPTPEAYEWAMREAQDIGWDTDSKCIKAFILVGDSYPHCPSYTTERMYWRDECAALKSMGVVVSTVVGAGSAVSSVVFMRELARIGGGVMTDLGYPNEHPRGWYNMLKHLKVGASLLNTPSRMQAKDKLCVELFQQTPKRSIGTEYTRMRVFADAEEPGDGLESTDEEERWLYDTRDEQWWDIAKDTGTPVFEKTERSGIWDRLR